MAIGSVDTTEIATPIVHSPPEEDHVQPDKREEPSDDLACYIIEGSEQNPRILREVPAHLRRYRAWFRDVVIQVLERYPKTNDATFSPLHDAPEFIGDTELRQLAGMGRDATPAIVRQFQQMAKYDPDAPENEARAGHPLNNNPDSGIVIDTYPPNHEPVRTCAACDERRGMEGSVTLYIDRIPTVRAELCHCMARIFESESPDLATANEALLKGSFVQGKTA